MHLYIRRTPYIWRKYQKNQRTRRYWPISHIDNNDLSAIWHCDCHRQSHSLQILRSHKHTAIPKKWATHQRNQQENDNHHAFIHSHCQILLNTGMGHFNPLFYSYLFNAFFQNPRWPAKRARSTLAATERLAVNWRKRAAALTRARPMWPRGQGQGHRSPRRKLCMMGQFRTAPSTVMLRRWVFSGFSSTPE
jgi:hypothetical protein